MSGQANSLGPQLLVSVRSAAEVEDALSGGADWIDLKEPNAGALAAVDVSTAAAVVEQLDHRRPLSAALGELRDGLPDETLALLHIQGISVVKLGLAACRRLDRWQERWLNVAQQAAAQGKQLVPVIYADWRTAAAPSPTELFTLAQAAACEYLLIDTYNKSAGSLLEHFSPAELQELLSRYDDCGIKPVVAGSLTVDLISQLPLERIRMLAVRGAICRSDRTTNVDVRRVEVFRQAMIARAGERQDPNCRKASAFHR